MKSTFKNMLSKLVGSLADLSMSVNLYPSLGWLLVVIMANFIFAAKH